MEIQKFVFKRLIEIFVIFFVILTVLFLLFRLAPGNPVTRMVDPTMTPEDAAYLITTGARSTGLAAVYLLSQKLLYRKFRNFFSLRRGGVLDYFKPASKYPSFCFPRLSFFRRLPVFFLGKIASWHKGEKIDTWMTLGALICHTLFLPWLALIMIWIFGFHIGWFPLNGMISPEIWLDSSSGFWLKFLDVAHHMVLPLATLFLIHFGSYLLLMRSSMLDTLKEDYLLTARAKGLDEKVSRNHHAAPNAALPVVTSVGTTLAFSLSGGALTETVFSWPGIGRELVFAVSNSDYPLAQASFLLIATVVLISNLVVDVLYAYLDPRIKY